MLETTSKPLLEMQDLLVQWSVVMHSGDSLWSPQVHPTHVGHMTTYMSDLLPHIEAPEFNMCRLGAERLLYILGRTRNTKEIVSFVDDLRRRIIDEGGSHFCLLLSVAEKEFYAPASPPFGGDVNLKFPSATYDIDEASKCIALDRGTAAAFHGIRCLESGIRALARCLGLPDPTKPAGRNWGAVLTTIKNEMEKRWPSSADRMKGDGEFFENAHAALAAMQNPWRNATMHLDQKYTTEEARHIFEVVRGFMKKLASRLDEDGLPLA